MTVLPPLLVAADRRGWLRVKPDDGAERPVTNRDESVDVRPSATPPEPATPTPAVHRST
jgi:hypothetical protein